MALPINTYTGDAGAIQSNIDTLTKQLTSQIQGAPQVRTAMGESLAQTEGAIPILSQQRGSMIEELFKSDQDFAQKYGTPESEMYIENPVAREQGIQAAQSAMWGGISGLGTQISSRQQLLGDAIERGMALYDAGLKAKQIELDTLQKNLDRLDAKAARDAATEYQRNRDEEEQRRWEMEYMLKAGPQPMTKEAAADLQQLEVAQSAIDEIQDAYQQVVDAGLNGPSIGVLNEKLADSPWLGMNKEISNYKQKVNRYALALVKLTDPTASGGGTGNARMFQIYADLFPRIPDNTDEGMNKLMTFRNSIAANAEMLYRNHGVKTPFNPYEYAQVKPPKWISESSGLGGSAKVNYDPSRYEEVEQ